MKKSWVVGKYKEKKMEKSYRWGILYLYVKKILFIYQKWAFLTNNIEIKRYKTFDSGGGGVKKLC